MLESRLSPGFRGSSDVRPDARVAETAPDCWGVFTLAELVGFGLSKEGVLRRHRAGHLHRLYAGVYVLGYFADAPEARMLAAVRAAGSRAVLSHRAAAWLWGFLEQDEPKPEVTIASQGARSIEGIAIHRSHCLEPRDRTRHRGVPITTPARTIVDLAGILDEVPLRQAVRRAQGHRRLALPSLLRAMERLGRRRGLPTLRRIVSTGQAPARTVLEDVVLDLLLAAGFEHPDVNRPLVLSGRRLIPDFRWPGQRLILEADGAAWHDHQLDAERQALLEAHGETVLRVSWEDTVRRRPQTIARVAAAGAPRAAHPTLTCARFEMPPRAWLG